jgi:hypothetical protein
MVRLGSAAYLLLHDAAVAATRSITVRQEDFMTLIDSLVQRYLATFNETDARRRRDSLDALYGTRGGYTDPHASLVGGAAVDEFIGAIQHRYPGVVFTLAGKVDAHHDVARFTWHAMASGALEPVAIGFDVMVVDGERIRQVYGFLDKSP